MLNIDRIEQYCAEACPATDLPQWLADIIPWLDGHVSDDAWNEIARDLGLALRRERTAEEWRRAGHAVLAEIVREGASHADDVGVVEACARVAAMCDAVAGGTVVSGAEFEVAAEAARAAASASASVAASVATYVAAGMATYAAASAAKYAVRAARAAAGGTPVAAEVAGAAAADRIAHGVIRVLNELAA